MSKKTLIGVTDYVSSPFDIEQDVLGDEYKLVALNWDEEKRCFSDSPDILAQLKGLLVWHSYIDDKTTALLKNCEIISRYGVGHDNIELPALERANIKFCNTPDYGTEEVADTTMAMILGLQRKIHLYDFKAREITEGWQEHVIPPLSRLSTQTVGVIGVGRIGTAVINRLKAFNVNIIGFDPYQPRGHEKAVGYKRVDSLDELLKVSDIISLNCILTDETRGMVNQNFLNKVKPGAIIVNTARGGIIDNLDVVIDALLSKKISGAGLDVLPQEPPAKTDLYKKWLSFDDDLKGRLIINPHSAYFSDEAWYDMRRLAALSVKMYLEKKVLRSPVTKS